MAANIVTQNLYQNFIVIKITEVPAKQGYPNYEYRVYSPLQTPPRSGYRYACPARHRGILWFQEIPGRYVRFRLV